MNVREQLIQIWINRVELKMIVEETSAVSFVMGKDFREEDFDFINNNVIPELKKLQYQAYIERFGGSSSCNCHSSNCHHGTGKKFIVKLI